MSSMTIRLQNDPYTDMYASVIEIDDLKKFISRLKLVQEWIQRRIDKPEENPETELVFCPDGVFFRHHYRLRM
jgi:hypothetical protein